MKNYVIKFNDGTLMFFNNKRAIENKNNFQEKAICYEIPENVNINDIISLQIGKSIHNSFKKIWS